MVGTRAKHLLVEYHGCDRRLLNDVGAVSALMRRAAEAAGARVVAEVFHPYRPQGVTGVLVIEESHFSVHTWPECGYAAVDFYTCGDCVPENADEVLRQGLGAERMEVLLVRRGLTDEPRSMRVEPQLDGSSDPRLAAPVMLCGQRAVLLVTREVEGTSTNVARERVELVCDQESGHAGPHRDGRHGEQWDAELGKATTVLRHEPPER